VTDQGMVKHEVKIGYQPKLGRPQLKTRCADLAITCQPGSVEEKSLVESMFNYLSTELGGQYRSMWIASIKAGDREQKWGTGESIYVKHPADDKPKPADDRKAPPATSAANPFTREQWGEWAKPWVVLGYDPVQEIPEILSTAQKARGGESFTRVSQWDSSLEEASAVMSAYHSSAVSDHESAINDERDTSPARPPVQPQAPPSSREPYEGLSIEDKRNAIRIDYTIRIGKKDYLQVMGRVLLFRLDHPVQSGWAIETELSQFDPAAGWALSRAVVRDDLGRVVASGHGLCTLKGAAQAQGRYIEKSETTAIGRALAIAGYGSDDSLEDDASFIADSPVDRN